MSEALFRGIGTALLCGVLSSILRQLGWKGVPVLACVTFSALLSLYGEALSGLVSEIHAISAEGNIERYAEGALKILGVGLLSGIISDMLTELSEAGLARAVTVISRIEILGIAIPFLAEIIDTGLGLLA